MTSKKPRVYLCHPVSAHGDITIDMNLKMTEVWLQFFVDHTTWSIGAPWYAYVKALAESKYRERGLADDLAQIAGQDFLIAVNNRRTNGMELEMAEGNRLQKQVIDITGLGYELPPTRPAEIERLLGLLRGLMEPEWQGTVAETSALAVVL